MNTFRILLAAYAVVFLALAINPVERDTWFAENLTVWIIVGTLLVLRRRGVTFTPLAYALMFVLVILHTIGGHYTFARVPFGWVTDLFGFQRNHYDRIAHFSVGLYAFAIAEHLDTRRLVANRALLALCPVAFIAAVAVGIFLAVHFTAGSADDRDDDGHDGDHRFSIVRVDFESKAQGSVL